MTRCGCKLLSELDNERAKHQETIDENIRYCRKIKDLHDELEIMHNTVGDLEKRYSELSARYRKALLDLDEANDVRDRLKDHSSDVADGNRRLTNTCERLQKEVATLREAVEESKEEAEDERRKRIAVEASLTRDLDMADRTSHAQLRRVASAHELDSQNLRKDISRLHTALEREKYRHDLTRRTLHHASLHATHMRPYCHHHSLLDCPVCYYIP